MRGIKGEVAEGKTSSTRWRKVHVLSLCSRKKLGIAAFLMGNGSVTRLDIHVKMSRWEQRDQVVEVMESV